MTPSLITPERSAPVAADSILPAITPDPVLESLIANSNVYCYSVDYRTGRFRYVSPGITGLLGYDPQSWQFAGPQRAFKHIHPDDQECIRRAFGAIRSELVRHPVRERKTLSFAFTCRVRNAVGEYVHLNHQLTFPRINAEGYPITDFTVVTDVSALQAPHTCSLHVRRTVNGRAESLHTKVFTSADTVAFSKRELEVLDLVAEGCSSQQIGKKLYISYNTVCTHRKNLMKKADVNGTVELLRYARRVGLVR